MNGREWPQDDTLPARDLRDLHPPFILQSSSIICGQIKRGRDFKKLFARLLNILVYSWIQTFYHDLESQVSFTC